LYRTKEEGAAGATALLFELANQSRYVGYEVPQEIRTIPPDASAGKQSLAIGTS